MATVGKGAGGSRDAGTGEGGREGRERSDSSLLIKELSLSLRFI